MSEETDMIDSTRESIEWIKPIKGHEDYLITNNGMVWSRISNRWLKPWKGDEKGHLQIDLGNNYEPYVHRLVYQTFVGPIPKGFVVHHLDKCPENNNVRNLKAMTQSDHSILHNEGRVVSQQTKQKISRANKGKKRSQQFLIKWSEQRKGHIVSQETRDKISNTLKGHTVSQQTKIKISESSKGKKLSPESIAKRQQTRRLRKLQNPNYGKR